VPLHFLHRPLYGNQGYYTAPILACHRKMPQ
jgi:hypothetical protein